MIYLRKQFSNSIVIELDRDVLIHKNVNVIARAYQFSGMFFPVSVLKRFGKRLTSARTETRFPSGGPFMARDGDGHEGRTRSRGASRGSPECRLKQR